MRRSTNGCDHLESINNNGKTAHCGNGKFRARSSSPGCVRIAAVARRHSGFPPLLERNDETRWPRGHFSVHAHVIYGLGRVLGGYGWFWRYVVFLRGFDHTRFSCRFPATTCVGNTTSMNRRRGRYFTFFVLRFRRSHTSAGDRTG